MVRAVLNETKTQTRRICKGQRELSRSQDFQIDRCPYGKPGDRLWVREAWQYADWTEDGMPFIRYRADGAVSLCEDVPEDWDDRLTEVWAALSVSDNYIISNRASDSRWRSPIFMPRWAARIAPEVVIVRVERLQAISAADALAEGVTVERCGCESCAMTSAICQADASTAIEAYRALWESINGPGSWDANPLVWVVEFKRVES